MKKLFQNSMQKKRKLRNFEFFFIQKVCQILSSFNIKWKFLMVTDKRLNYLFQDTIIILFNFLYNK